MLRASGVSKLVKVVSVPVLLAVGVPLCLSCIFNVPIWKTLALVASTYALEYFAAAVGVSLGLDPIFTLAVMTCTALSVVLALFYIFELVGEKSRRVRDLLQRAREKVQRTRVLQKYGVYGLVIAVPLLGFYVCPAVAWIMGWRRNVATTMIAVGFILTSAVVLLASLGIIKFLPVSTMH